MKRKVVKHGPATYIVSLPSTWVKKFNICKGDEIDVQVDGDKLVVCAEKTCAIQKAVIDLTGRSTIIEKTLGAMYKKYDEILVRFDSPEELAQIQHVVGKGLIGLEIVDEKSNSLIIKEVSALEPSEFNTMLKRTFVFLISMAEDCLKFASTLDEKGLGNIILRDHSINKLTDYCRRSLCKHGHDEYKPVPAVYVVVELLEKLGDAYKDIAREVLESKKPIDTKTIDLYKKSNKLLEDAYNLFYSFKIDKMELFMQNKKDLDKQMKLVGNKIDQPEVLFQLRIILLYLSNLSGPIMITYL